VQHAFTDRQMRASCAALPSAVSACDRRRPIACRTRATARPRVSRRSRPTSAVAYGGLPKLPVRNDDGDAHVVVETTRGSAAKLEYDPDLQVLTLSKALILGLTYPYDWGFIPSTKGRMGSA
jgi:Inorganic pyrophosphatase